MSRFFSVNRDIFFRTLCLVIVTMFFTSAGAAQGETVLAVNTLLMQLFTLFSYIMDGFAYAGEALAGKYIGARNRTALHQTVRQLFGWGIGLSLCFTLLYAIGGRSTKQKIIFIGCLLFLLPDFPLFFGTVSLSAPQLPGTCLFLCL